MNYEKKDNIKCAMNGEEPIRSQNNFLVYGAPLILEDEINEVVDSLKKGWIGTGAKAQRFEQLVKEYKGIDYAIALNSCTAALHLSMLSSGVTAGDEVITTPMTFCATINSIIHCGATPVLADCDRQSFNITAQSIEEKITPKTKAILLVHFAGRCCEMDDIIALAKKKNLIVIEDCAHALESEYHGRKAGTFGNMGCFSFYVTKNITTGEGGMVITSNEKLASQIKMLGLHGMSKNAWKRFSDAGYKHYEVVNSGFKYNMMDLQAAIGLHQFKRIEASWQKRQDIWNRYQKIFKDLPCILPADVEENTKHAYHLYNPLIDIDNLDRSRDWVLDALTAENIGVGVHYVPIHMYSFYQKKFGWKRGDYPNSEWIGERTVSLPLSPALNEQDIEDVIKAFQRVLS